MFKRLQELLRFAKVRAWYKKHERLLLPGAILFGLIGDFITVRFIDLEAVQIILSVHIVLSGLWIAIIHSKRELIKDTGVYKYLRLFAPLALYYSFGAMFSMFLVLYSNSGSLFSSAPFLVVIAFLLVGTEVFKEQFKRLPIQVVVYFTALFSYLNLVVPYVTRELSSIVFLISGILSLLFIWGYLTLLERVSSEAKARERLLLYSVVGVFFLINLLYFTNMIPPFPLSLRDVGIYKSVSRDGDVYRATRNQRTLLDIVSPIDTIYVTPGQTTLSTYSAIFAPTKLSTEVVHEWKRWQDGRFRVMSRIAYPIIGGRDGGYRGYTYTSSIVPGFWWVTVETGEGKVIGGTMFVVKESERTLPTVIDIF